MLLTERIERLMNACNRFSFLSGTSSSTSFAADAEAVVVQVEQPVAVVDGDEGEEPLPTKLAVSSYSYYYTLITRNYPPFPHTVSIMLL